MRWKNKKNWRRNLCGIVANTLDNDILESEFELQSQYYVHVPNNTLIKSINLLIPSVIS